VCTPQASFLTSKNLFFLSTVSPPLFSQAKGAIASSVGSKSEATTIDNMFAGGSAPGSATTAHATAIATDTAIAPALSEMSRNHDRATHEHDLKASPPTTLSYTQLSITDNVLIVYHDHRPIACIRLPLSWDEILLSSPASQPRLPPRIPCHPTDCDCVGSIVVK